MDDLHESENEKRGLHLFDLLLGAGPALRQIFSMGFRPKREDMYELTAEQYESFYQQHGHMDEKVYILLPRDPDSLSAVSGDPDTVMVFTESDIDTMERGWQIVENYCSKAEDVHFDTDEQKMQYAAALLPDVFTKGSRFEGFARGNIRVVYKAK